MKFLFTFFTILLITLLMLNEKCFTQNDVMLQAFYWDVPVDAVNNNGTWWNNLMDKADDLKSTGFTGLWIPPPSKGNWGIIDNGYGIYDHYDLGNYNQKGTIETRFGSRTELLQMISTMHQTPKINVYADVVLNHLYGGDNNYQNNPALKQYCFDKAYRNGNQWAPYQVNEIQWVIPGASAGDYYIQIKGYCLNWTDIKQRGYDIFIDWTNSGSNGEPAWEYEPNNSEGQFNVFPGSGRTMRAHTDYETDIDEYKITLSTSHDIVIILTAKQEGTNGNGQWEWQWTDQSKGYYPYAIWYNEDNLANTTLEVRTKTNITYPIHNGTDEPDYSWTYSHFHPVDQSDYLQWPGNDEIIPNCRMFGNDFNTFNSLVQSRLKDWGYWLANTIGFDGFRLDYVRGFQQNFVADWVKNLPLLDGQQRFIVGEYWGADYRIKNWVNDIAGQGADVDGFDFPLRNTLKEMCNGNQSSFNMAWLNHSGLIRNNSGNNLAGTSVVTFLENHDTGKESDKWVTKDFRMGYAYILTHEGRPCVFYPHFYNIVQRPADPSHHDSVQAPASLKDDIKKLIFIRKTYLGGTLTVLSEVGNPYPASDTYNVYAARRQGNGSKDGAIIVINNHDTETKGLWLDSSPAGFSNWAGLTLKNALAPDQTLQVEADGRVLLSAPPRGYSIWIKSSDYVAF